MDMVKSLFRQRDTQLTRIPECDANGTVYVTGPGGALNVDVLSVIPGVGAANLGKAEDAVHASGDTGVMGLAVRQDAATALGANGDYVPLIVDEDGKLWVRLDSDIEIGAVELKDATTAQRAIIDAAGQLQIKAIAGAIVDGGDVTQGTTTDAAVVTDANGTISGKLRGLVKWAFERMPASLGQKTKLLSLPVTLASDEDAVAVTGTFWQATQPVSLAAAPSTPVTGTFWQTTQPISNAGITISQTPTVTAGIYTANDAVGGLLTFANAARVSGGGGVLKDVIIIDDNGQDAIMELWLFDTTITAMADNAPWAPSEADLRKLVGIASTGDGAWRAAGTPSSNLIEVSQRYDCVATTLYGQLVTRGTPTFANTDDVTIRIGCLVD